MLELNTNFSLVLVLPGPLLVVPPALSTFLIYSRSTCPLGTEIMLLVCYYYHYDQHTHSLFTAAAAKASSVAFSNTNTHTRTNIHSHVITVFSNNPPPQKPLPPPPCPSPLPQLLCKLHNSCHHCIQQYISPHSFFNIATAPPTPTQFLFTTATVKSSSLNSELQSYH